MDDKGQDDARKVAQMMRAVRGGILADDATKTQSKLEKQAPSSSSTGPFERFKSFVDDSISTLTESLHSFPSNVAEAKDRMQEQLAARNEEEVDIWRRWTGRDDSAHHIRMLVERASEHDKEEAEKATTMLIKEAFRRSKHLPQGKIFDLYKDGEYSSGEADRYAYRWKYDPNTADNLAAPARWGLSAAEPRWLSVNWFKRSPYSPVRLEPRDSPGSWRAPFEDLLLATLDKPLDAMEKIGQRPPFGRPESTYSGPGLDWMLSLQCRGILPPQLPSLYFPRNRENFGRIWESSHDSSGLPPDYYIESMWKDYSEESTRADMHALMAEIAIKPGPEPIAEPARMPSVTARLPPAPWRVPSTEAELYEQMKPNAYAEDDEDDEDEMDDDEDDEYDDIAEDEYDDHTSSRNMSLQEYQMQLMLLEQQNKKRLLMAKEEQASLEREESRSQRPSKDTTARPDVLSQLTTTHTTYMPDGTVTTKIVLKQKFADGREETHESEQVSHERKADDSMAHDSENKSKKSGWFWS